jgi:hypothetical protein
MAREHHPKGAVWDNPGLLGLLGLKEKGKEDFPHPGLSSLLLLFGS